MSAHLEQQPPLELRPVCKSDSTALGELIARQSQRTRRLRFHGAIKSLPAALLQRMAEPQASGECAWVVACGEQLLAEARCTFDSSSCCGEFALLVDEAHQRQGLGTRLLQALAAQARAAGMTELSGWVQRENTPMLALLRQWQGRCTGEPAPGVLELRVDLYGAAA
jgi:GNAT superfamily N-acetyltransferase